VAQARSHHQRGRQNGGPPPQGGVVPEFYHGLQQLAAAANRSVSSGYQWRQTLPEPDAVMPTADIKRSRQGWKVSTLRDWAENRQEPLRTDLLEALKKLEATEREYRATQRRW
jgi:hypothetical protein